MFGKVTSLNTKKMFGFIKTEKADYFFHKDDCDLHWADLVQDFEDDKVIEVEFEPIRTEKGLRAESVRLLRAT